MEVYIFYIEPIQIVVFKFFTLLNFFYNVFIEPIQIVVFKCGEAVCTGATEQELNLYRLLYLNAQQFVANVLSKVLNLYRLLYLNRAS